MGGQRFAEQFGGIVGGVFGLAVFLSYYVGMESSASQATLGKKALGLKVTDLYGRRISVLRPWAVPRHDPLGPDPWHRLPHGRLHEKKQALHDKLAGTLVLRSR